MVDSDEFDIYSDNWTCGVETSPAPTNAITTTPTPVEFRIPPNLVCGAQGDRIVGGLEAIPHSWPWMAYMWFGSFICGGTIVDDGTLLNLTNFKHFIKLQIIFGKP